MDRIPTHARHARCTSCKEVFPDEEAARGKSPENANQKPQMKKDHVITASRRKLHARLRLDAIRPVDGGLALTLDDVVVEFTKVVACDLSVHVKSIRMMMNLTWRAVVADGEVRRNVGSDVAETVGTVAVILAVVSSATDLVGALPDDLGEVAVVVEDLVGHVGRSSLVVEGVEVRSLVVVEVVRDDG